MMHKEGAECPSTSTIDEVIQQVKEMVMVNWFAITISLITCSLFFVFFWCSQLVEQPRFNVKPEIKTAQSG